MFVQVTIKCPSCKRRRMKCTWQGGNRAFCRCEGCGRVLRGAKAKALMGVEDDGKVTIRGNVENARIYTGDGNNVIYGVDELECAEVGGTGAYSIRAKKITGSAIGNGATVVNGGGRRSRKRRIKALREELKELEELEKLLDEDW